MKQFVTRVRTLFVVLPVVIAVLLLAGEPAQAATINGQTGSVGSFSPNMATGRGDGSGFNRVIAVGSGNVSRAPVSGAQMVRVRTVIWEDNSSCVSGNAYCSAQSLHAVDDYTQTGSWSYNTSDHWPQMIRAVWAPTGEVYTATVIVTWINGSGATIGAKRMDVTGQNDYGFYSPNDRVKYEQGWGWAMYLNTF